MHRRQFIGIVAAALCNISPARAQRPSGRWRIGALVVGASGTPIGTKAAPPSPAVRQALQELGYVEGGNLIYIGRNAGGRIERLPELARELAALGPDLILTSGSEATHAAKQATRSIPIVFLGPSYPVEEGLVASFARPGGNITGITLAQSDHVPKLIQLLRDVVPALNEVTVIWSPDNPGSTLTLRDIEAEGTRLKIKVYAVPIKSKDDAQALAAIARLHSGGLILSPAQLVYEHSQRISELALRLRLPSVSSAKSFTEQGLLFSYGADVRDLERRVAGFVDRILKGAKPSDIPVERPTKFELAINMNTARSIGLTVPQSLLLRADHVIN